MSDITVTFKNQTILTMDASGSKPLLTEGKYCEDDITIAYVRPAGPFGTKQISITQNGTVTEDVAAYASAEISVNVQGGGGMEPPTGGKTRFYVTVLDDTNMPLHFSQNVASGVSISWGDGSSEISPASTGRVSMYHTYSSAGTYAIDMTVGDSCTVTLGGANNFHVFKDSNDAAIFESMVDGAFIGDRVLLGDYAFSGCQLMTVCEMRDDLPSIGYNALNQSGVRKFRLPSAITSMAGNSGVSNGRGLVEIELHEGLTSIGGYAFSSTSFVENLTIPSTVTSIGTQAFTNLYSLSELHFKPTTPPTISSRFTGIPASCIIYVQYSEDHSILTAYQNATNISEYAAQMQEEPQ